MGNNPSIIKFLPSKFKPNSTVILTGTDTPIGEQLAIRYAERGCNLLLLSNKPISSLPDICRIMEKDPDENQEKIQSDNLENLVRRCQSISSSMRPSSIVKGIANVDLLSKNDIANILSIVEKEFENNIDILVLNCGISTRFRFNSSISIPIYEAIIRQNFLTYVNCTKVFYDLLEKTCGQVVVISAFGGEVGLPLKSAFSASKFAIVGFFESVRSEFVNNGTNITVTIVCPPALRAETDNFKTLDENHFMIDFHETDVIESFLDANVIYDDKGNLIGVDRRMEVGKCVDMILLAADRKVRKMFFPIAAYYAVYTRPFFPDFVDPLLKRFSRL